jgi:hypothetical protein
LSRDPEALRKQIWAGEKLMSHLAKCRQMIIFERFDGVCGKAAFLIEQRL